MRSLFRGLTSEEISFVAGGVDPDIVVTSTRFGGFSGWGGWGAGGYDIISADPNADGVGDIVLGNLHPV